MPQRSGLGAQLGIKRETTYGTYVAPTRFLPFTSEGIELAKQYIRSRGLRSGKMAQASGLHKATTRAAEGPIVLELLNQGFGMIFDLLHGDTVVPTQIGVTGAYRQTHDVGLTPPWGKSLTCQVGRPDVAGTVQPFSYLGTKLTQMQIAIEAGGSAVVTLTTDARDEDTAQTLAAATYTATAEPFTFNEMTVEVADTVLANVRSITITIPLPQNVGRYHLGNAGVKDQPIANDFVDVVCAATLEFASLADHNRFKNETVVKLELNGVGDAISTEFFRAGFTMAAAKQVSSGPAVEGPDVITSEASFEALDNGTLPPLSIDYVSTETAL